MRLAPAALGEAVSVQQHLRVERDGRADDLDAVVEIDAAHVGMVGLAFGQRVLTLNFDGQTLTSWRHPLLPRDVQPDDVLQDLQLTLWPAAAIAEALPDGWRLEESGSRRTLYRGPTVMVSIDYSGAKRWSGTATLDNLLYHYRLIVRSAS